jgi:tetraprenyl-beta-curcumene synthase
VRAAFVGTIAFYALVVLRLARREHATWRRRAEAITDPALREPAVTTLREDQMLAIGAAAFAVLHPPAARRLIPLLVAYQVLFDLVDTLLERPRSVLGGSQAALTALEAAVTADGVVQGAPNLDFVGALVDTCRRGCAALPRYSHAQPALVRISRRCEGMLATHTDPEVRAETVRAWAGRHPIAGADLEPAELSAATHSSLATHALIATAAKPHGPPGEFEAIEAAYFPWTCALGTLLDSLIDQEADATTGNFSFVGQYGSTDETAVRLRMIAEQSLAAARTLPSDRRHAVLVCSLVGMSLATPSARKPRIQPVADALVAATAPFSSWARAVVTSQQRLLP